MTFLESIFDRLQRAAGGPVLVEIHEGHTVSATGAELLALIQQARAFLAARGLKKYDRCALLVPNNIRWVALDLALAAEGIIVVPLYCRQAPAELVAMLKDSLPAHIFCADAPAADEIQKLWLAAPPITLLDAVFAAQFSGQWAVRADPPPLPCHHADADPVTIVYTSGTSGEAKGVVLTAANVTFMLGCTTSASTN